jgi:FlaA1/EpsC-like NDP-sugar epimerase
MRASLRKWLLVAVDTLLITAAYFGAYVLRIGGSVTLEKLDVILTTLPVILIVSLFVHLRLGLYHAILRYASLETGLAVLKATLISVVVSCTILFLLFRLENVPRAVFFIYGMAVLILVGSVRIVARMRRKTLRSRVDDGCAAVILFGVEDTTEWVLRGLEDSPSRRYRAVGIIDEDPVRHGRQLRGVKIHGGTGVLPDIVSFTGATELWVCVPGLVGSRLRRIYETARQAGLRTKVLPRLESALLGSDLGRFHEPEISDLLRRAPRALDRGRVRRWIQGRRILITGAGGSIGSELARQVARFGPRSLALCDASEFNLFKIHGELSSEFADILEAPYLVDVRDARGVQRIFDESRPEIVFQAAAHKHVPLVELNPCEGVLTNVLGLYNVARAGVAAGVTELVFISTDKAVRPSNVMGATKRLGEILIQALQRTCNTRFSAVRFGNVLGSSGSVVPIFQEQIRSGGPVTVTHPEMTRFFMLVSEAVELVMQAGSIGRGGEVFVLDMGEPVNIAEMARDLIVLMGKEPDHDVRVEFSGLRPGEKIHEELLIDDRDSQTTFQDIWIDGEPGPAIPWSELEGELHGLFAAARRRDRAEVLARLAALVTTFSPSFASTRDLIALGASKVGRSANEIEERENRLARTFESRTHAELESQRSARDGFVREALDLTS